MPDGPRRSRSPRPGLTLCCLTSARTSPGAAYPLGTAEQLQETVKFCTASGARVHAAAADVREQSQVDDAVAAGIERFGRIDVLVNNAGVVGPAGVLAHELAEEDWALLLDINLSGSWRCAKAVLPGMATRHRGVVVNIASTAGSVAFRCFAGYVAAKHGVVGLTKALALDYAPYGIRVNAVSPTSIYDDPSGGPGMLAGVAAILRTDYPTYEASSHQLHPLKSLVYAEDVAAAVLWLSSDAAARVTGTVLSVDAGFTVR